MTVDGRFGSHTGLHSPSYGRQDVGVSRSETRKPPSYKSTRSTNPGRKITGGTLTKSRRLGSPALGNIGKAPGRASRLYSVAAGT